MVGLSNALKNKNNLSYFFLDLRYNKIGNDGLSNFSLALEKCSSLSTLILFFNQQDQSIDRLQSEQQVGVGSISTNLASEGGVAKETHLEKLYQNNQREFVDENPGEVDEQKPEEEKSQICVPAFCNRQKMSLDIEQSSNCISPTNFDRQAFLQKQTISVDNKDISTQKCQGNLIIVNSVFSSYNEESPQKKQINIQDCVIEEPTLQSQITQKTEMTPGNYQKPFIERYFKSKSKSMQGQTETQGNQTCQNQKNENFKKHLIQKILAIQDINISRKIKQIISKIILCKVLNVRNIKEMNSNHQNKIQDQINNDSDILSLFKDILFLKKAVMLMLTKDQLAVLQHIGCSSNFLDIDLDKLDVDQIQQEKLNSLSHFEVQFAIYQSKTLQQKYSDQFLQRCYENENLSCLDNKILSSLKKSYQNYQFIQSNNFGL
ncbi:hypothetical protein ABPG74_006815 [Tetrahymena malaccensis]